MNSEYEKRLEKEIGEVLKGLPELRAPETFPSRVMAVVARRPLQPWYRQSWAMWPARLRYATLLFLLGSFGALCLASWQLARAAGVQLAVQEVAQLFSSAFAFCGALLTVLNGLLLAAKHVHPAILAGGIGAFACTWALFVGLSTACAKLAFARR